MKQHEWKDIPGYKGKYLISNSGEIKNSKGKILKQWTDKINRRSIGLTDKTTTTLRVHRLVMAAFIGPCPEGKEVCHRDGNASNNALSNLYYGTRSENELDKVRHGTKSKPVWINNAGEKNPMAILSEDLVKKIKNMLQSGVRAVDIASSMSINKESVFKIKQGRIWKNVTA